MCPFVVHSVKIKNKKVARQVGFTLNGHLSAALEDDTPSVWEIHTSASVLQALGG